MTVEDKVNESMFMNGGNTTGEKAAFKTGFLAGYQDAQEWISEKPVFTDAAVFVSAIFSNNMWHYTLWMMIWTDGYNEKQEPCRYLALCCEDGEEWGDYADLSAHKYLILTPPNKEIKPC